MKILVIQLARLGDIYQTWPTLNALVRQGHEVHLLTREKFAAAGKGCRAVHRQWVLDSRSILQPLIDEKPDLETSLQQLSEFSNTLKSEKFDRIINLSFSPFSSFLTDALAGPTTEIKGYTRQSDGTLAIPDDSSAYFYAQVGRDRGNRVHLTDLFASVAGVDLDGSDWKVELPNAQPKDASIVVHIGASDLGKTFAWSKWLQIVRGLNSLGSGNVVLVGSKEEVEIAEKVSAVSGDRPIVNLVGKTSLDDLFSIVARASLVIGGDSAPIHIATLTNTPVLNISFPSVCLWETGPRSNGSRILSIASEDSIASDEIVREAKAMLKGETTELRTVNVPGPMMPYLAGKDQSKQFQWELLKALYMGESFPPPPNETFLLAIERLHETNVIALEQIEALGRNPGNQTAVAIIDRCDDIMVQIERAVEEVGPIIRWFQVERLRIGPQEMAALIEANSVAHRRLGQVLEVYGRGLNEREVGGSHDDVNLG
ncbi:MAG TPA: glycosyltransferase family 9 protein [Bdellovibrionales bacterium]|nr:glycosyltransferase family 9 protein [Bdellovibrionales bacterium]